MKKLTAWIISLVCLVILGLLTLWISPDVPLLRSQNRIGVIEIKGLISSVQDTLDDIKRFRNDRRIKAIVLRIESPGGGVGPSQEIYREIRRTIESKPVVASLGSTAASGGYYIASAANRIVANPGTVTGSIGVIVHFPNLQEVFDKIGYYTTIIKSGEFKDIGNPGREMTAEEKSLVQGTIDEVHKQFIQDVARARNLSEQHVREIADGRIFTGQTARQLGLVDELGNFEDAVKAAASLGKIEDEPTLVRVKRRRSVLDLVLGSEVSSRIDAYLEGGAGFLRYQAPYALKGF